MKHESRTERLSGPLALCCAIAVFLAAAFDVTGAEAAPAVAGVVRVAPWPGRSRSWSTSTRRRRAAPPAVRCEPRSCVRRRSHRRLRSTN